MIIIMRIQISTHMNTKPYQVAISKDSNLIRRKWDHKGTIWAITAKDAIGICANKLGLQADKNSLDTCKFGDTYIRADFGV